ncbi:hypothetical protein IWW34DRAFT_758303 [Fusarium oxysporum f. sp. albedinis]|nr:hypothetical protein IWW34DRAFT_758303 [Fusarium oxysporum f. sp. albedinis]
MSKRSDETFRLCGTSVLRGDGVSDDTLHANERKISWGIEESIEETFFHGATGYHCPRSSHRPALSLASLLSSWQRRQSLCRCSYPISSGINISVMCVINSVPGANWDETHSTILSSLSKTIMGHFRRQPS